MERVLVIGPPGAGKSTLARMLSGARGLPLIHLDQHFWQPGWIQVDPNAWRPLVRSLAQRPRWVMDGNYGGTLDIRLPAADTVIFLDFPRWLCLSRTLWRALTTFGRNRPDMADGCPERFDFEFLHYVWTFNKKERPHVVAQLQKFAGSIVVLRTVSDVAKFSQDMLP